MQHKYTSGKLSIIYEHLHIINRSGFNHNTQKYTYEVTGPIRGVLEDRKITEELVQSSNESIIKQTTKIRKNKEKKS